MALHFLAGTPYGAVLRAHPAALEALIEAALSLGVIFVADDAGLLVGMIAVARLPHPVTGDFYADELVWWVEPDYRRGSLGPRLIRRAETWARDHDLTLIQMVAPIGTDVGAFYLACGYVPVETAYQKTLEARTDGRV